MQLFCIYLILLGFMLSCISIDALFDSRFGNNSGYSLFFKNSDECNSGWIRPGLFVYAFQKTVSFYLDFLDLTGWDTENVKYVGNFMNELHEAVAIYYPELQPIKVHIFYHIAHPESMYIAIQSDKFHHQFKISKQQICSYQKELQQLTTIFHVQFALLSDWVEYDLTGLYDCM